MTRNYSLTDEEIGIVLNALSNGIWREVNNTLVKLQQQMQVHRATPPVGEQLAALNGAGKKASEPKGATNDAANAV